MVPIRVDLASDTLTSPSEAMRQAMAVAPVGDDVFGEDPSVNQLEARIAKILGTEDAIFLASGTMSNQIAMRIHCQPGEEFLCEANCHIYTYEQAAYAQLFGIAAQPIEGTNGLLELEQVADRIRPRFDNHAVRTKLFTLENTHNRAGGRVHPYEQLKLLCDWARENELKRHLDGARLWNAVVATGIRAADWAQHFDTISVCFSKGLGAPVGSALCGTQETIQQARRVRKALGGAMRQVGILAAGAFYALENNQDRILEDHAMATCFANKVLETEGFEIVSEKVETKIVIFSLPLRLGTAAQFCERMLQQGVRVLPLAKQQVRAVFHLDITPAQVEEACHVFAKVVADCAKKS